MTVDRHCAAKRAEARGAPFPAGASPGPVEHPVSEGHYLVSGLVRSEDSGREVVVAVDYPHPQPVLGDDFGDAAEPSFVEGDRVKLVGVRPKAKVAELDDAATPLSHRLLCQVGDEASVAVRVAGD